MVQKYQVIKVTDMRTKAESYKIYKRGGEQIRLPIEVGFKTAEEAEARIRELEAGVKVKS